MQLLNREEAERQLIAMARIAALRIPRPPSDLIMPFYNMLTADNNAMMPPSLQLGAQGTSDAANSSDQPAATDELKDPEVEAGIAVAAALFGGAVITAGVFLHILWRSVNCSKATGSIAVEVAPQAFSYGTGSLLGDHVVLTDLHVVWPDYRAWVKAKKTPAPKDILEELSKKLANATISFTTDRWRKPRKLDEVGGEPPEAKDHLLELKFDPESLCLPDIESDVLVVAVMPFKDPKDSRKDSATLPYLLPHIAGHEWQKSAAKPDYKVLVLGCWQRKRGFFKPGQAALGGDAAADTWDQRPDLFYRTNTEPEMSGGIVCDLDWRWVAFHRGFLPRQGDANHGVSIHVALKRLSEEYERQRRERPQGLPDLKTTAEAARPALERQYHAEAQFIAVMSTIKNRK